MTGTTKTPQECLDNSLHYVRDSRWCCNSGTWNSTDNSKKRVQTVIKKWYNSDLSYATEENGKTTTVGRQVSGSCENHVFIHNLRRISIDGISSWPMTLGAYLYFSFVCRHRLDWAACPQAIVKLHRTASWDLALISAQAYATREGCGCRVYLCEESLPCRQNLGKWVASAT